MSIPLSLQQWLGEGLAFLITVGLLSYILFGGHDLFRIVVYGFIGAAVGYLVAIVVRDVFFQRVGWAALRGFWPAWVALLLAILLWTQPLGQVGRYLSGISLAVLTAVSAAVLLGGAARGSLIPLAHATARGAGAQGVLEHLVALLVTVLVLLSFQFVRPRRIRFERFREVVHRGHQAGQILVGLALAAVFVAAYRTALFLLTERVISLGRLLHFIVFGS